MLSLVVQFNKYVLLINIFALSLSLTNIYSGKALGYGLDSPSSILGIGVGEDFSSLRIQTGIRSATYKMSSLLGVFPGGKGGRV